MCKCGKETAVKKTGECMKCYSRRKYLESVGRTELWRGKNGVSKYKYMSKTGLRAEIDKMKTQLRTLAERECDNCHERDCADCWAMEYNKLNSIKLKNKS